MYTIRDKRLAMEFDLLRDLVSTSDLIQIEPITKRYGFPPEEYIITYTVHSIVNINYDQSPVYGDVHRVRIVLPPGYPMAGSPSCFMLTSVWHPNIRFYGEHKGHICINKDVLGSWQTLDMLVEQIGEMLQYKNYHAINEIPYPEDAEVARWIREYAEPRDIVNKYKKIFTDSRSLLNPTEEWLASRRKKVAIIIKGKINYLTNAKEDESTKPLASEPQFPLNPVHKPKVKITIKKS